MNNLQSFVITHNKSIVAIVVDNKNQIIYNGKKGAISTIANEINASRGCMWKVNGFLCFCYDGIPLFKLRPDQQENTK